MGDGGGFLLHGGGLSTILLFIFSKAEAWFFSTINFRSLSLHFLQHWLLDRPSPLVGIAPSCLVGGFVI